MNKMEQIITQIAENCKRLDEFIFELKKSFKIPPDKQGDFFLQVGLILYNFSYFRLALNSWNHALEYFLENRDRDGESTCYTNFGLAHYSLGDFRKAIEYCEKSLKIIKETGDKSGESNCYTNLGAAYKNLGHFRKAIEYHEKSLKINKEIGDRSGESACYTNLGLAHYNLGEFRKAIKYYEKSLEINTEIGNKVGESKCYTNLGLAYRSLGDFRKAIEYHEKSLGIDKEIGNKAGESACYTNLGISYDSLGDFREAIEYHEKSLKIIREIKDKVKESACYTNLGLAHFSLGDFRKAIEYHEKSLKIIKGIGNKAGESKCYTNLGLAYRGLGDFRKAIEYYERSLRIDTEIGDRSGEAKCYTNLGVAYRGLGNFRKAIEYHEKSLEINTEIGNKSGESKCYTNLGLAHFSLGDFRKAIEYYERSLKINIEIGDKSVKAKCYGNFGISYHNLGEFRKAIKYYEKSLEIIKEIGEKSGESAYHENIGIAYNNLGHFRKAIEHHEKSLEIDTEIGDRSGEAKCYTNLGAAYRGLGNFRKAIDYYERSLKIIKETGDIDSERIATLNLCRIYYRSKRERAYEYCKRSIELSEMISGNLIEEQHKIGFSAQASDAYQYMVPLCLTLQKEKKAFDYTERGKSRAFLDLLAATEIKPTCKITGDLQPLLDNEEVNLTRLREIQMRHLRPIVVSIELGEIEKIYENLTQIYNQIEQFDPEYVFTRRGKPLSLAKIQNILSSQQKDAVLIEYFITEEKTYIFVISSRNHQLHIESVPFPAETFNQYLKDWKKIAISLDFQNISNYLIEPISEYVNEGDLIYFVPYGPLHYFPLHAPTLNGKLLIKNHPVAYLPSASILPFCQNKGTGRLKTCTSFGVAFEKEAEAVADLFDTKAHTSSSANRKNVKACNTDIIHFACHGKFDDKDPLSSGVTLHDGELTARDIFTMRLTTELVTLSACETGYNQRSPGDELIGLTRAFLYAGAPSVIVTLWPVYGRSAQKLMLEFYKQLKNGTDKAVALQQAQITLMKTKRYSRPFYWAPFILIGNWK